MFTFNGKSYNDTGRLFVIYNKLQRRWDLWDHILANARWLILRGLLSSIGRGVPLENEK